MIVSIFIKKQLHLDYLNYIFERDAAGNYVVDRRHDFGKLVVSLVKYSKFPVPDKRANTVKFMLPASRPLENASKSYVYITKEDQAKLNDFLDALFNIDFDRYYLDGMQLKFQQKDIIQAFIVSRKLVYLIGDNETLKKRAYRDELKKLEKYSNSLYQKAYNRHSRIKESQKTTNYLTAS